MSPALFFVGTGPQAALLELSKAVRAVGFSPRARAEGAQFLLPHLPVDPMSKQ